MSLYLHEAWCPRTTCTTGRVGWGCVHGQGRKSSCHLHVSENYSISNLNKQDLNISLRIFSLYTQNTHSCSWRSNVEETFQVAKYSSLCRHSSETCSATSSMARKMQSTHLPSLTCRKRKNISKSISDISKVQQKPKSYPRRQ